MDTSECKMVAHARDDKEVVELHVSNETQW